MIRARTVEPRRSRLALSLLVWALCALLGPGPALQALHFSLVQHRICPEHGELLHVSTGEGAQRSATFLSGTDVSSVAQGTGGSTNLEHEHDACGVSLLGSVAAVWPADTATVAAGAELPGARRTGAERAHVGIALLHYAPKLEPPSPARVCLPLVASVLA
ncbi:MAG TPA: hypothetical protein VJU61_16645 [Polyangiaceae bacterium]|nr:hypothetical protein [Polyangiaceae bacterium]